MCRHGKRVSLSERSRGVKVCPSTWLIPLTLCASRYVHKRHSLQRAIELQPGVAYICGHRFAVHLDFPTSARAGSTSACRTSRRCCCRGRGQLRATTPGGACTWAAATGWAAATPRPRPPSPAAAELAARRELQVRAEVNAALYCCANLCAGNMQETCGNLPRATV